VLNKKFYKEEEALDAMSRSNRTLHDDMPSSKYILNVVVMSIMWTTSAFSFYLLNFMNKHYEGNIYLNYYLDGASGIIGCLIA
jgi:hypothetical protein